MSCLEFSSPSFMNAGTDFNNILGDQENEYFDTDQFLRYLNNEFVPEIDLTPKAENVISFTSNISEDEIATSVGLSSQTPIDMKKGVFSERRDVVYKTLLRNTRRYLFGMFQSEFPDVKLSTITRGCPIFGKWVRKFYDTHFLTYAEELFIGNLKDCEYFIQILATFITGEFLIPKRSSGAKKISLALRQILKTFSPALYSKFFKMEGVSDFFKILKTSGIFEEIFSFYDNIKASEGVYSKALTSIISFNECPMLIR